MMENDLLQYKIIKKNIYIYYIMLRIYKFCTEFTTS